MEYQSRTLVNDIHPSVPGRDVPKVDYMDCSNTCLRATFESCLLFGETLKGLPVGIPMEYSGKQTNLRFFTEMRTLRKIQPKQFCIKRENIACILFPYLTLGERLGFYPRRSRRFSLEGGIPSPMLNWIKILVSLFCKVFSRAQKVMWNDSEL